MHAGPRPTVAALATAPHVALGALATRPSRRSPRTLRLLVLLALAAIAGIFIWPSDWSR